MNGRDQRIQVGLAKPDEDPSFSQFLAQALRQGTLQPDPPNAPEVQYFKGHDVEQGLPPLRDDDAKKYPNLTPETIQYLKQRLRTTGVRG